MSIAWSLSPSPTADARAHTSLGFLFTRALLAAPDLNSLETSCSGEHGCEAENLQDDTFNFRDPSRGLNLDLPSYAMYVQAGGARHSRALLNATLQAQLAERTFSTFFKHYVSSNLSLETGGWAYQALNASLPSDLGPALPQYDEITGTEYVRPDPTPVLDTNRRALVTVETPVELLEMNAVAVWLSIAILIWLIITTVVVAALERRYLRNLKSNIECIADVLVLIAGSDKLLQLVRERGLDGDWGDAGDVKTKLGWFEDGEGRRRWGIEIVEGGEEEETEEEEDEEEEEEEEEEVVVVV